MFAVLDDESVWLRPFATGTIAVISSAYLITQEAHYPVLNVWVNVIRHYSFAQYPMGECQNALVKSMKRLWHNLHQCQIAQAKHFDT